MPNVRKSARIPVSTHERSYKVLRRGESHGLVNKSFSLLDGGWFSSAEVLNRLLRRVSQDFNATYSISHASGIPFSLHRCRLR